jgi:hypothetical protein
VSGGLVIAAISAIAVALATVITGLRWIYRQGGEAQKLASATEANTTAVDRLSAAVERQNLSTDGRLLDHERRLVTLEARGRERM